MQRVINKDDDKKRGRNKRREAKKKHLPQDSSPPPSSLFGARCLLPIALLPTATYSTKRREKEEKKLGCEQANDQVPQGDSVKVESKVKKASANTRKSKEQERQRMRKETRNKRD
jgi:hypothetical protein